MTTFRETKARRAWQTLFSALDKHLAPFLPNKFILAISGGPDSRALLESIARWPKRLSSQWHMVAIDHGIRAQSTLEASLVAARAKSLGFSATVQKITSHKRENEQSLREKRYIILKNIADQFGTKFICFAHHCDDNAEGYLMSLLGVGGGSEGSAMGALETHGEYSIIRPFVELSKNDLLLPLSLSAYTDFAIDNFDQDRVGQRALVRHEILPGLRKYHTQISLRLDLFANNMREKRSALEKLALPLITWKEEGAEIELNSSLDRTVLELAIRLILKKCCPGQDLRQSRPTVKNLINHVLNQKSEASPGLDPPSKWFIVNKLETKVYQLPGAVASANGKEILFRRV